jgi:hypothetical protein
MGWGVKRTGKDLRVIGAELRHQGNGREISKKFRRELRATAAPIVPVVRASALAIPVKGTSGSTGLRKRLARSVKLTVRTAGRTAGVRIQADPKWMPDHQKSLPQMMEGTKPFRHPVFGDRAVWRSQESHPWFFPVVERLGPLSRAAAARVIRDITREIT